MSVCDDAARWHDDGMMAQVGPDGALGGMAWGGSNRRAVPRVGQWIVRADRVGEITLKAL